MPRAALAVQQTEGTGGVANLHKTARRAPLRVRAPTGQRGPAPRPPRGCSPPRSWLEQSSLPGDRAGTRRAVRSFLLRRFAFIDRVYGKARGPGAVVVAPKRPIFRGADEPGEAGKAAG